MYSKAEKSNIKKEFWTSFGMYMKPVLSAEGEKINWVNYKTGVRYIFFRMDADTKGCSIAIEIRHPQQAERGKLYGQIATFKKIFTEICGANWLWLEDIYDEDGAPISKIYSNKEMVNVFKKDDWPEIISFLKEGIIRLDEFWALVKANFE